MMKTALLPVMLLLAFTGYAQTETNSKAVADSSSSVPAEKNKFSAGMLYSTRLHYYGRVDSLQSRGIIPFINFTLKNGLYATGSALFVNNVTGTAYAGAVIEGGYQFKSAKENWSGNIFGSKNLYRNKDLVQSAVKAMAGINLRNKNRILNLNAGADLKFSDRTDIGVTAGIDHVIKMEKLVKGVVFAIDPSVYAYAGTQNFVETYTRRKTFLLFPGEEETVTHSNTKFGVLSYEFSCPVIIAVKKLSAGIIPAYVLPQNTLSGENTSTAKAPPLLYATLFAKITL